MHIFCIRFLIQVAQAGDVEYVVDGHILALIFICGVNLVVSLINSVHEGIPKTLLFVYIYLQGSPKRNSLDCQLSSQFQVSNNVK